MLPIYVINLDRAPERRAWMTESLTRFGIDPTFIKAVDGRRFGPLVLSWLNRQPGERRLSPLEAALILSHRKAWRRFLASGVEHAIVMEDDVHLAEDLLDIFSADWTRWSFHVLKLETMGSRVWLSKRQDSLGKRRIGRLYSTHFGAAAYLISRAGAAHLLRLSRTSTQAIDGTLFSDEALADPGYLVLQMTPAVAAQDDFLPNAGRRRPMLRSSIGHERGGAVTLGRAAKLWREVRRPFRQAAAAMARWRYALRHPDQQLTRVEFS